MNILNSKAGAYVAVAVVGLVAAYFIARKIGGAVGDAAAAVGTAVNPTSDQNLAYRGVNAVGEAISGSSDWTLGGAIYDWTHPAPKIELQTRKQAVGDNFWTGIQRVFTP